MNKMNSSEVTSKMDDSNQQEGTPLDDLISRVDSYIKDPKLVTPETLMEMKSELEDLKSYMDQEESPSGETADHKPESGVAIMIGNMKKGMK